MQAGAPPRGLASIAGRDDPEFGAWLQTAEESPARVWSDCKTPRRMLVLLQHVPVSRMASMMAHLDCVWNRLESEDRAYLNGSPLADAIRGAGWQLLEWCGIDDYPVRPALRVPVTVAALLRQLDKTKTMETAALGLAKCVGLALGRFFEPLMVAPPRYEAELDEPGYLRLSSRESRETWHQEMRAGEDAMQATMANDIRLSIGPAELELAVREYRGDTKILAHSLLGMMRALGDVSEERRAWVLSWRDDADQAWTRAADIGLLAQWALALSTPLPQVAAGVLCGLSVVWDTAQFVPHRLRWAFDEAYEAALDGELRAPKNLDELERILADLAEPGHGMVTAAKPLAETMHAALMLSTAVEPRGLLRWTEAGAAAAERALPEPELYWPWLRWLMAEEFRSEVPMPDLDLARSWRPGHLRLVWSSHEEHPGR